MFVVSKRKEFCNGMVKFFYFYDFDLINNKVI